MISLQEDHRLATEGMGVQADPPRDGHLLIPAAILSDLGLSPGSSHSLDRDQGGSLDRGPHL